MNVGSSRRWRGDMTDIVASGDTILTPVGMAATPFPAPSGEVNPDRGAAVSSWRVATCEPTGQAYQSDLSGAPGVGSLRPCRTLERLDISEPGGGRRSDDGSSVSHVRHRTAGKCALLSRMWFTSRRVGYSRRVEAGDGAVRRCCSFDGHRGQGGC